MLAVVLFIEILTIFYLFFMGIDEKFILKIGYVDSN